MQNLTSDSKFKRPVFNVSDSKIRRMLRKRTEGEATDLFKKPIREEYPEKFPYKISDKRRTDEILESFIPPKQDYFNKIKPSRTEEEPRIETEDMNMIDIFGTWVAQRRAEEEAERQRQVQRLADIDFGLGLRAILHKEDPTITVNPEFSRPLKDIEIIYSNDKPKKYLDPFRNLE
jgi:hypothetical protein